MRPIFRVSLLAALLGAGSPAHADGAPFINFQGSLTGVGDGAHKLVFNVYDFPNAITPVWGPQTFDTVPVVGGRYDVILGSTDAQGRSLASAVAGKERYLSVNVDGQEAGARITIAPSGSVAPAVAVSPAPSGSDVGLPAGTVVALWSAQIPSGWLLCDGSPVPEGSQYDKLRALVNGKLPDLRGVFLRGAGQNGDAAYRYEGDASRAIGSLQPDEFKAHAHAFDDYTFSENNGVPGKAWGSAGKSDIDNSPGSPFKHDTATTGGGETRPKNAAVTWVIKY